MVGTVANICYLVWLQSISAASGKEGQISQLFKRGWESGFVSKYYEFKIKHFRTKHNTSMGPFQPVSC